jgi:spore coat protein U-like protein
MAVCAAGCLVGAATVWAANCTLNVQSVVFGTYDALSSQSVDSVGSITVGCDAFASYSLSLSSGYGTMAGRHLQSGASVLLYNLYSDTVRSIIWGDGSGGTALVNGSGTSVSYSIYGRVPGRQNVMAGVYSDTVTVSLIF